MVCALVSAGVRSSNCEPSCWRPELCVSWLLKSTVKQKLGVDFRRSKILGACNPPFAHEALQAELEVGLMLPCNVVVYEGDDGRAVVLAVDPTKTMAGTGNPKLAALAETVKEKLVRALALMDLGAMSRW